jgi:hypothetical protein
MAKQIYSENLALQHRRSGLLYILRELIHSVLSLIAPIVGFILATAGLLGLLDCLIHYIAGQPTSHFPMGLMLGISLGSLVLAVLLSELLNALDPNKDS